MAKTLMTNGDYSLLYDSARINRYILYKTYPASPSGDLKLNQMICQSSIFSQKIKSYFTEQQCQTVIAKIHAMKYMAKRFRQG